MPTYNILGVNVFVPDLNDLATGITNPITAAFSGFIGQISSAIISGLSFLNNIGGQIASAISNSLYPAFASLVNPIASFFAAIPATLGNALNGISNSFASAFQYVSSSFGTAFAAVGNALQQGIVAPLVNFFASFENKLAGIFGSVAGAFAQIPVSLSNSFLAIAQSFSNGFQSIIAQVQASFAVVGNGLNAFGGALSAGLTNFGNQLNIFGQRLQATFVDFGKQSAEGLQKYIIKPFIETSQALFNFFSQAVHNINQTIKQAITAVLPHTPEQAFDSALLVAETGLATIAIGELTAIGLELGVPTKHMGFIEVLHKVMDAVGITAVGAILYEIIIHAAWGKQLTYYMNYTLQPTQVPPAIAQKGVYYGSGTLDQYIKALKYEGFNDEAINLAVSTIYQPLPPRMITKLIDNGVLDTDFFADQLRRSGLDPNDVPNIIKAFQQLKVAQYQSTARQIVATASKHGYLNNSLATQSLRLVGVPDEQIKIILYFAQLEAQDALLLDVEDTILTLMTKGGITPEDAEQQLVKLGLDSKRAIARVKLKAIKAAPNPSKEDRLALANAVLDIPLVV